jgi:hypothetical protein
MLTMKLMVMSKPGLSRVRTSTSVSVGRPDASDNPTDVRRTACRPPLYPVDGMADGMPSATPPGERHGGRPPNYWSPAPTVGWMADGRSVRRSRWRSAGRQTAGWTAWRTPPPGPSTRGRPPEAVRHGPSARGRPPRAVYPAKTLESHNY